ncbi:MAG: hypothetical protein GWN58_33385 [Anaerolineae bacterium]|nr:hypothetical protein [Thermoplasmata archaeon]NIV34170.1 hypothetical protein [Anaerolineae bacterium]NIY06021.1 hypothetical protein [Thermoplasmata archaeon]
MKISEIVKGTDVNSRIVKYRANRSARRRADLLESISKDLTELQGLSRGVQAGEGLDVDAALNEAVQAVRRLKMALSGR